MRLPVDVQVAGDGPPVVLVHGSASSNRQWQKLAARLSGRHRVIAPQLRGYGATPAWTAPRRQTLDDAAEVVLACCAGIEEPIRLVGHSYGGAVALCAARTLGARASHLALYEPMLPGLLLQAGPTAAAAEVTALYADVRRHGAAGDWLALGERFTDYFNGDGSWAACPPARRAAIAAALPPNLHEWEAVMVPLAREALAGVTARGLLLCGTHTRPALHAMAERLAAQYPDWRFERLEGCGHMAPLTQAERIDERLSAFVQAPVLRDEARRGCSRSSPGARPLGLERARCAEGSGT